MVSNLPAPGRVLTQRDPEYRRKYRLYVPTRCRADRPWPLVVACHGTRPWDTARRQLDTWKGLAEQKGFLLAAPELVGTAFPTPSTQEQISRQMDDERAILAMVRSIRAARSVDEARIFLTGWSAGAYAVLFTGLRHPDIFRALAIRQGNFDAALVEPCIPFLDRYQPIMLLYGSIDPLKEDALASRDWLRSHGLEPRMRERPGPHRRGPEEEFAFFAHVVRRRPWIRIHVRDNPLDDMEVSFSVKSSFEPISRLWDFGDDASDRWEAGEEEPSRAPDARHRYAKPGLYTVRVKLEAPNGKSFARSIRLQVPRIRLGVTPPSTGPAP